MCLFNAVIAILLYLDDVVFLSKPRASLERYLNKLYEFPTSSSLDVNLSKTKIVIIGHNKIKINQEAFYLAKNHI